MAFPFELFNRLHATFCSWTFNASIMAVTTRINYFEAESDPEDLNARLSGLKRTIQTKFKRDAVDNSHCWFVVHEYMASELTAAWLPRRKAKEPARCFKQHQTLQLEVLRIIGTIGDVSELKVYRGCLDDEREYCLIHVQPHRRCQTSSADIKSKKRTMLNLGLLVVRNELNSAWRDLQVFESNKKRIEPWKESSCLL